MCPPVQRAARAGGADADHSSSLIDGAGPHDDRLFAKAEVCQESDKQSPHKSPSTLSARSINSRTAADSLTVIDCFARNAEIAALVFAATRANTTGDSLGLFFCVFGMSEIRYGEMFILSTLLTLRNHSIDSSSVNEFSSERRCPM